CTLMLRPEQVVLDPAGMPAVVQECTFYGHDATLTLRMGADGTGSTITVRLPRGPLPRPGEHVQVRVSGDAVAYANQHPHGEPGATEHPSAGPKPLVL